MLRLIRRLCSPAYSTALLFRFPFRTGRHLLRDHAPAPDRARTQGGEHTLGRRRRPNARGLWIHAPTAMDIQAIHPLLEVLRPQLDQIWVSTATETGRALASELFGNGVNPLFLPLDWPRTCRRWLQVTSPRLMLLTRAPWWPGLICSAHTLQIPVLLINGQIQPRSDQGSRLHSLLQSPLLKSFHRRPAGRQHRAPASTGSRLSSKFPSRSPVFWFLVSGLWLKVARFQVQRFEGSRLKVGVAVQNRPAFPPLPARPRHCGCPESVS